jgi:hypothetical protein
MTNRRTIIDGIISPRFDRKSDFIDAKRQNRQRNRKPRFRLQWPFDSELSIHLEFKNVFSLFHIQDISIINYT